MATKNILKNLPLFRKFGKISFAFICVFSLMFCITIQKSNASTLSQATKNIIKSNDRSTLGSVYAAQCKWNENININNPFTPSSPDVAKKLPVYGDKLDLLNKLQIGDIVFDPTGFGGLTGHTMIVQGKYEFNGTEYIRVIEASGCEVGSNLVLKVFNSILDDQVISSKNLEIYRPKVSQNNPSLATNAVKFAEKQLGKDYTFDYSYPISDFPTSINHTSWYCSLLVWASWYNEGKGINIRNEYSSIWHPSWCYTPSIVTPRDIAGYSRYSNGDMKLDKIV